MTAHNWKPFGIPDAAYGPAGPRNGRQDGVRVLNLALRNPAAGKDRAAVWLRNAMIALAVLAAAAAVVSFQAQYRMVLAAKHTALVAALEAGIPDAAALIFAALGIALALHGKRAIRPRLLNVGAVVTSVAMNLLAAGHGWRDLAIWVMPPVAYALASDTAIGVIRAYTLARQRSQEEHLAGDETTPLAAIGGVLLWLLRLALAPGSTLTGFRRWVIEECPVAPGRRAGGDTPQLPAGKPKRVNVAPAARPPAIPVPRGETKTARFLALVEQQHGPLGDIPLDQTARLAGEVAPLAGLHPGSARRELRSAVQAAQQDGGQR